MIVDEYYNSIECGGFSFRGQLYAGAISPVKTGGEIREINFTGINIAFENFPDTVRCEEIYVGSKNLNRHKQGMASDYKQFLYWSHNEKLVKSDFSGKILKMVDVPNHHGDLTWYMGNIYVAVNHGEFSTVIGLADNWIYVYDGENLNFIRKMPVPELAYGAGGIGCHHGRLMVVGGVADLCTENYVFEYDLQGNFIKRHTIASGATHLGIQTINYWGGKWYLGCYGPPNNVGLIVTDYEFKILHFDYNVDPAKGNIPIGNNMIIVGDWHNEAYLKELESY